MQMGRPDYEDSIAGGASGNAAGSAGVDAAHLGEGSSIGRVTEGDQARNTQMVFGTRTENNDG